MKRVEQHVIKLGHEWFDYCNQITNFSSQLFNSAQYVQRQGFFYHHGTQSQAKLDKMFQQYEAYKAMPSKVAQLVLQQSVDSWSSYFTGLKAYKLEPSKFTGEPQPPGYADCSNLVKFNNQAVGKREFKQGHIVPSMSPVRIPVKSGMNFEDLCEVRIVPHVGCFVIEVVYEIPLMEVPPRPTLGAAIDIGLDNLATIVFGDGRQPIIINGKPLKSENQFYNKQLARFKGFLPQNVFTSKRIEALHRCGMNQVDTGIS